MSDANLRVHLQRLFRQNSGVNLSMITEMSRVSVQPCTENDLVLWVLSRLSTLNPYGDNATTDSSAGALGLSVEEIAAEIAREFGVVDALDSIQATLEGLFGRGLLTNNDGLYALRNNIVIESGTGSTSANGHEEAAVATADTSSSQQASLVYPDAPSSSLQTLSQSEASTSVDSALSMLSAAAASSFPSAF